MLNSIVTGFFLNLLTLKGFSHIRKEFVMNEKALRTLEYYKIIEKLEAYASSAQAKDMCRMLKPSANIDVIVKMQQETADALSRVLASGRLSFSGLSDVRASIKRLEVGGALTIGELLAISKVLDVALRAKAFSEKRQENLPPDSLSEFFELLAPHSPENNEIKRCIIDEDTIADDASAGLKAARRQILLINNKIKDQLQNLVNDAASKGQLQNNIITMRNGRYCLPVKAEHKSQIQGMMHDQSSTGSTVFIEPLSIVKLNNELAEAFLQEQKEIQKVLADLSNLIAEQISDLEYDVKTLVKLDFIFAKAELAKSMNASMPDFNKDRRISLKKARHPLIDPKKVVPTDIRLGDEFNLLVVTGPNTGGKTVSLKTMGLLSLMGQAGLHIPAFDHSELGVFKEIFADIGDEQSIEQNLSTFSSHMINTVNILKNADSECLALFDEPGAGTDPTEGAALAMSILSWLHDIDARVMATTHYSELKIFALGTPGVCNACCEFDVETLAPTYRLLIGVPGKSNAFAISSKLGLPDHIIEDAKKRIGESDQKFEDVIASLEDSKKEIEKEQEYIAALKKEAEELRADLDGAKEKLESQKSRILDEARVEAEKLLSEAKDFADETIRNFNKWGAQGANKDMENARNELNKKLSKTNREGLKAKTPANKVDPKKLHIGDSVNVLSLGLKGTVSTLPNAKGDLFVQMGILRSQVNVSDLELTKETIEDNKRAKTGKGSIGLSKSLSVSTEINLIGMTTDEAIFTLDKYLDDAYLAHLPSVRIIHGNGTGALRSAVQAKLKKTKYVKGFHLGEFGEGDHGVTIAEFREG